MPDPIVSSRAHADLHAIYAYIAADNVDAAKRVVRRLNEAFDLLAQRPFLGRVRLEIGADVRSFVVHPYLVLYRPAEDGVDIARVIHGAREVGRVFRDERP